jgi:hypothetical protein
VIKPAPAVVLAVLIVTTATSAPRVLAATTHTCPNDAALQPWQSTLGAAWLACQQVADLTTTGNPWTDPNSLTGMGFPPPGSGTLNSHYADPTTPPVSGIQLYGYFPDGCNAFQIEPALTNKEGLPFIKGCVPPLPLPDGATCAANCHHDAQFVLRIPDTWNGTLLSAGTPGIRDAFASDFILSDYAMEKGWAYVSQDKGNMGANFYHDACDEVGTCAATVPPTQTWPGACGTDPTILTGPPWCAGLAIAEWNYRMRQATRAARALLNSIASGYGLLHVTRSYAAGISNGGYQVRRALETDTPQDQLYDGGVDWEGTLFLANVPANVKLSSATTGFNLFTYLPTALQHYPGDVDGTPSDVAALAAVGFNPQSQPLWAYHWTIYWGLTQKIYRLEFDPEYTRYTCGDTANVGPPCVAPALLQVPPDDADALYSYAARVAANPALVTRLNSVANTGNIQRPLITLHGDQDSLLPIATDSDLYSQMVPPGLFRYYVVQGGNHVDPQFDDHYGIDMYGTNVLRPMLPCVRSAIDALAAWVEQNSAPPPSHTILRPTGASASDLANRCSLN